MNRGEIAVAWSGFRDDCAMGIETYDISLQYLDGTWQVLNSTIVSVYSVQATRHVIFPVPANSGYYKSTVCATGLSGLTTCTDSDGFVNDLTPATLGRLCVAASSSIQCNTVVDTAYVGSPQLGGAMISWSNFRDAESGIGHFRWAVGTTVGGSDVRRWENLGWETSRMVTDIPYLFAGQLFANTRVYVTVVCVNGAALESNVTLALIVDSNPPYALEGAILPELDEWSSTDPTTSTAGQMNGLRYFARESSITVNVDPSLVVDLETPLRGVVTFDVTDLSGTVVHRAANLSIAQSYAATFVAEPHAMYQAMLRVSNIASMPAMPYVTIVHDPTPPSNFGGCIVCDANGIERPWLFNPCCLAVCCDGFGAPPSGILAHRVTLSNAQSGTSYGVHKVNKSYITRLPSNRWMLEMRDLSLPLSGRIRVQSEALSGAGVAAAPLVSHVDVDGSAPTNGFATFGDKSNSNVVLTSKLCVVVGQQAFARWGGFVDSESGIAGYAISMSDAGAGSPPTAFQKVGRQERVEVDTRLLTPAPAEHVLHVRASNNAYGVSVAIVTAALSVVEVEPRGGFVALVTSNRTQQRLSADNPTGHGFFTDASQINVRWDGFVDASGDLTYTVCIGSTPFGCQLAPFGTVTGGSWMSAPLSLHCGALYYATISATNCAGLQRTVTSRGAKLCCEPPSRGSVTLHNERGDTMTFVTGEASSALVISWSGFVDSCSGLRTYSIEVRDTSTQAIVLQSNMTNATTLLELPGSALAALADGASCTITLTAFNNAGLSVQASSSFVIDRTPPVLTAMQFRWRDSADAWLSSITGLTHFLPYDAFGIDVRWSFVDGGAGSGGLTYSVARGNAADLQTSDFAWMDLGSASTIRFPAQLLRPSLQPHVFAVRACDRVGHCHRSAWSDVVWNIDRSPSGGHVSLGSSEINSSSGFAYRNHGLMGAWGDFTGVGCPTACGSGANSTCFYDRTCAYSYSGAVFNANGCNAAGVGAHCRFCGFGSHRACPLDTIGSLPAGPELTYKWCLGSTPNGCQLTQMAVATEAFVDLSAVSMPCASEVFLLVQAQNRASMQHTVVSRGVKVCCDPPLNGTVMLAYVNASLTLAGGRYIMTSSGASESVFVRWIGFGDACAGVRAHSIAMTDSAGHVRWVADDVAATISSIEVPQTLLHNLSNGEFVISVTTTSRTSMTATSTATLLIDDSPPSDGAAVLWVSDGSLVVVSTLGGVGDVKCVPPRTSHIVISAAGMRDLESGIASHAVELEATELQGSGIEGTGVHRSQQLEASFLMSTVFPNVTDSRNASVRACNRVGLCRDETLLLRLVGDAPQQGDVTIDSSLNAAGDFLNDASEPMQIRWDGFVDASGDLTYTVCIGSTPFGCQLAPFGTVTGGSWMSAPLSLHCGALYYATISATNCAGLQRTVTSRGAKLCCEPPSRGSVTLHNERGDTMTFVTGEASSALVISWSGFVDSCSGLRTYSIEVRDTSTQAIVLQSNMTNATTLLELPGSALAALADGASCTITLTAFNNAGLSVQASSSFVIDRTPPIAGTIYTAEQYGANRGCQLASGRFSVSWGGFEDLQSGLQSLEWALGTEPGREDLRPYRLASDLGYVVRSWTGVQSVQIASADNAIASPPPSPPGLAFATDVYASVRATNNAGAVTVTSSPPVRIIEDNCTSSWMCLPPDPSPYTPSGIHPLFAPLLHGLTYDVSSSVYMPREGDAAMRMKVHLHEVIGGARDSISVRPEASARLFRLQVDGKSAEITGKGARRSIKGTVNRACFFWKEANGTGRVLALLHHPDEDALSLKLKKLLVSSLQMPHTPSLDPQAQSPLLASQGVERDFHGEADTQVNVSGSRLLGLTVMKYSVWRPSPWRPVQIKQDSSSRLQLTGVGVMRTLTMSLVIAARPTNEITSQHKVDKLDTKGFDMLPPEPYELQWTLNEPHIERRRLRAELEWSSDPVGELGSLMQTDLLHTPKPKPKPVVICDGAELDTTREAVECHVSDFGEKPSAITCARKARQAAHNCPASGVEALVGQYLVAYCGSTYRRECGSVVALLAYIDTAAASDELARFVRTTPFLNLRSDVTIALASRDAHPVLLDAMIGRLRQMIGAGVSPSSYSWLLLATSSSASKKVALLEQGNGIGRTWQPLVANVSMTIEQLLVHSEAEERRKWDPLHSSAELTGHQKLERMNYDHKQDWVAHQAHLSNRRALSWEISSSNWKHHEAHARRVMQQHVLHRDPAYSEHDEVQHHARVISTLRAVKNLRTFIDGAKIASWLHHRDGSVAVTAAEALCSFEDGVGERDIIARLKVLHSTELGEPVRQATKVITKELTTALLRWKSVSSETMGEVVKMLLSMPHEDNDACNRRCKRTCNPLQHTHTCISACTERCTHHDEIATALRALVKKGLDDHDIASWVVEHMAAAHPSQVIAVRWHDETGEERVESLTVAEAFGRVQEMVGQEMVGQESDSRAVAIRGEEGQSHSLSHRRELMFASFMKDVSALSLNSQASNAAPPPASIPRVVHLTPFRPPSLSLRSSKSSKRSRKSARRRRPARRRRRRRRTQRRLSILS